ncbi:large extracellular alpha-helical protein [Corallococcus coralloides]|uniref:Large extracellular alpha-helical protein n=1 Tax=Corallococcus coralloides TaxID=184914 RepID=A0A410RWX0_CORCK|nr:alpha-2-macroglobulin family protein [Corallococcus coralloides]QAT86380.1 large extracellular alpha-helical protein [Corallococcus coralloides]
MSSPPRPRTAAVVLCLLSLALSSVSVAAPAAKAPPAWKAIDALVEDDKVESAAQGAEARLAAAKAQGDADEWTRALVRTVQLRTRLHGYETAVRFLREQPWPEGLRQQATLHLFYAAVLAKYQQAYSYEIGQREQVVSSGPVDLKAWTKDQLSAEIQRTYAAVWESRRKFGTEPVKGLSEYLQPNTYPEGIRSTVRDAVTYLWVDSLDDTDLWRPEQEQGVYRLDLGALLEGTPKVELKDPSAHPLMKVAAVLGDLEAWHLAAGRREAALEARLRRYEVLTTSFTDAADQRRIREHLAAHLKGFRDVPWWSKGQNQLAELEEKAGRAITAHALAKAGAEAWPKSVGGVQCAALVGRLEAPELFATGMQVDGPGKRSILVGHRNVGTVYFRAYALDVEARLAKPGEDLSLYPSSAEMLRIVASRKPEASWSMALPPTPDFQRHQTFVTPPALKAGAYIIVLSTRQDFAKKNSRILSLPMSVSPWAVTVRKASPNQAEIHVVDGATGAAAPNVEVRLVKSDYGTRRFTTVSRRTDANGDLLLTGKNADRYEDLELVLGRGRGVMLLPGSLYLSPLHEWAPQDQTLIYTDRSVYRPQQKLLWKVVAYRPEEASKRYRVLPDSAVTVSLVDANGQEVAKREVRTNTFGSAAGEFDLPGGRALGHWTVRTSPSGYAGVRVEEYKRPTFEVTLKDAPEALRLNRRATFKGEARYYFGLPVTRGAVKWRVSREPVLPRWWFWERIPATTELVASGTATVGEDGGFTVAFTPEADERLAKAQGMSWRYRVEADLTDEGGETRSASRAFRLGFVSVEGRVDSDVGFVREDFPSEVRLVRSNLDGAPQAGAGRWRLIALKAPGRPLMPSEVPVEQPRPLDAGAQPAREASPTPGDAQKGRWDTAYDVEQTLRRWDDGAELAQAAVTHGADGVATVKLPALRAGTYRLRYETTDAFGQKATAQRDFVVAGARAPAGLPAVLAAERASVRVGEVARLMVASGFEGQPLVMDVYQGRNRVEHRQLTAGQGRAVVELPVTESLRGGFTVVLSMVRDWQTLSFQQTVAVPFDDKELSLEFATFRDTLRPGAKETFRVTVKGPKGAKLEAGAAELLAYMYDQSLNVFGPHTPPRVAQLYPQQTVYVDFRASGGVFGADWLFDELLRGGPSAPELHDDTLRFGEGYGLGGPGYRNSYGGRRLRAMKPGAVQRESDGAPPPPPPPSPAPSTAESAPKTGRVLEQKRREIIQIIKGAPGAPEPGEGPEEPLRSNFAETAFWIPQLLTGPDGAAVLEFTVPDSVTAWDVWVHALTRDLRGGSTQRAARSVKELMVRPYLPRFLREGDRAELEVVVNNAGTQPQQGQLTLDIVDPDTQKSLLAEFGVKTAAQAFTVAAGKGTNLRFPITTPARVGPVAFRVVAKTGAFSDGELRPLPVLPGRMHLSQSRFAMLNNQDRRTLTFEDLKKSDDPTRVNEQLVVTVDAQLFYSVLQALPYLVDYPYECTEQTLNRFVSTGIVSSLFSKYPAVAKVARDLSERSTRFETFDDVDPNRKMTLEETPWLNEAKGGAESDPALLRVLDPKVAQAQRISSQQKLRKAQNADGGFPWWPGGPSSPYMTLYILHGLSRAMEHGVEVSPNMTEPAWGYLAKHFRDDYANRLMKKDLGWEFLTFLNFVASAYPDARYTGEALTAAERQRMLDFSFKHWKQHSPYLKGYLALTLNRAKRAKDAQKVWDSVMDSAKTTQDLGTYWAPEDRSWLWYNDSTETHAFALRTLSELRPKDPRRAGLVQWLLLDKKVNHWKSTRATAEALYALVNYMEAEGSLSAREELKVTVGSRAVTLSFSPDVYTGKKNQVVVPGPEVNAATATTVVEKTTPGFAIASATWHFSTEQLPREERGDFFQVSRRYFVRIREGNQTLLRPLSDGARLRPGDEVEVQLSLRTKHAAEYVHLRDPRAAGLEPENARSRHKWDLGIVWYEETRDSGTNFFFESLPAGEYNFKYRLRANMAGTFRVGPATVQSMYAPEFTAYSTGTMFTVDKAQ